MDDWLGLMQKVDHGIDHLRDVVDDVVFLELTLLGEHLVKILPVYVSNGDAKILTLGSS